MSDNTTDYVYWQQRRNKVFSSRGGWQVGVGVHNFGYDMLKDLAVNKNHYQVHVLNCTGRLPKAEFGMWLSGLFTCLSWPDPRIWCNAMGALAGSLKCNISSGVASGILSSDSLMFGSGECVINYSSFIQNAVRLQREGTKLEQITKSVRGDIPGFARPLATGDERVITMSKLARELGFPIGEHEKLAMKLHQYMQDVKQESINIGGYFAAFMSDQGYLPLECRRIVTTVVGSGVHACHIEEEDNPPLSFMPMTCEDIDYQGVAKRKVIKP